MSRSYMYIVNLINMTFSSTGGSIHCVRYSVHVCGDRMDVLRWIPEILDGFFRVLVNWGLLSLLFKFLRCKEVNCHINCLRAV